MEEGCGSGLTPEGNIACGSGRTRRIFAPEDVRSLPKSDLARLTIEAELDIAAPSVSEHDESVRQSDYEDKHDERIDLGVDEEDEMIPSRRGHKNINVETQGTDDSLSADELSPPPKAQIVADNIQEVSVPENEAVPHAAGQVKEADVLLPVQLLMTRQIPRSLSP